MENLIVSFQIIMPLFLYMLLGYAAKKRGLLTKELNDGVNQLMFAMFLPVLLFKTLYQDDLSGFGQAAFIPYAMAGTVASFLLLFTLFSRLEKDPAKRGSLIQGAFRGNSVLYGLPVAISIFGEGNTAEVAIVLAAIIPIYNVLSVLVLEICGQAARSEDPRVKLSLGSVNWKSVGWSIFKNPLIHAVILGILANLSGVSFPSYAEKAINGVAGVVTPMAFVLLGSAFNLSSAGENKRSILLASLMKLVVNPFIFLLLPIYWGWSGPVLGAILISFGTPTAVSSFPMAKALHCDGDLAGEIVVVTSAASIVTMFLWIFVLKQMMLI
jgi:predicted permease